VAAAGRFTNPAVTLPYRPPELLLGARAYSTHVDMWSVGCVIAEMILGRQLLPGRQEFDQIAKIWDLCGSIPPGAWAGHERLPHFSAINCDRWPIPPTFNALFQTVLNLPDERPILNLIQGLVKLEPARRLSAAAALDSEYFAVGLQAGEADCGGLDGAPRHEMSSKKRREAKAAGQAGVVIPGVWGV